MSTPLAVGVFSCFSCTSGKISPISPVMDAFFVRLFVFSTFPEEIVLLPPKKLKRFLAADNDEFILDTSDRTDGLGEEARLPGEVGEVERGTGGLLYVCSTT